MITCNRLCNIFCNEELSPVVWVRTRSRCHSQSLRESFDAIHTNAKRGPPSVIDTMKNHKRGYYSHQFLFKRLLTLLFLWSIKVKKDILYGKTKKKKTIYIKKSKGEYKAGIQPTIKYFKLYDLPSVLSTITNHKTEKMWVFYLSHVRIYAIVDHTS